MAYPYHYMTKCRIPRQGRRVSYHILEDSEIPLLSQNLLSSDERDSMGPIHVGAGDVS